MANIILRPDWVCRDRAVTDEKDYINRREFIRRGSIAAAGLLGAVSLTGCPAQEQAASGSGGPTSRPAAGGSAGGSPTKGLDDPTYHLTEGLEGIFPATRNAAFKVPERPLTPEQVAATKNNFYEFLITSNSPADAWKETRGFDQRPWQVEVAGLVDNPQTFDLDDLARLADMEERLYRFRCVEAWAMTVPWSGFPFSKLCKAVGVQDKATHVRFVTFDRPEQAPGQRRWSWYNWPYYEGLRMDEAMNDLTLLAFGIYGHPFPMQHGAPVRIVTPWKYGYKSIKSLVRIEFTNSQPATFWNDAQPSEYGFLSNVNPNVPHPRWSQATETLIGTGERVKTKLYNGYADQVGGLYA